MSMMRASGAIPIITALQIATASFAVPKSVIKTIVGRVAGLFAPSSGRLAWPPQPAKASTAKSKIAKVEEQRRKKCTASPLRARHENVSVSCIRRARTIKQAHDCQAPHQPRQSDQRISQSTRRLRPLAILLVKLAMLVIRAGQLPLDEEVAHLRLQLQRIAVGHNDVRKLSGLERAQLVRQTKNLRGIQHHRFQRLVVRKSVSHGSSRILGQTARKGRAKTGKRDRNSGGK